MGSGLDPQTRENILWCEVGARYGTHFHHLKENPPEFWGPIVRGPLLNVCENCLGPYMHGRRSLSRSTPTPRPLGDPETGLLGLAGAPSRPAG